MPRIKNIKCNKCGRLLPVDKFYKHRLICKECVRSRSNEYYAKNADKVKNNESYRDKQRAYHYANYDKISDYQKSYHADYDMPLEQRLRRDHESMRSVADAVRGSGEKS